MEQQAEHAGGEGTERRQHHHLRTIFQEAKDRIDHCFHAERDWANSPIDYLAQRVVHEAYPHLTSHDVRVLVAAIERGYRIEY